jgi:hypothetical protein
MLVNQTVAREGALHKLSPALCAGKTGVAEFVAAKAATTKCARSARFCSGRLRGRTSCSTSEPRAERCAERGAKIVERAFARE